MPTNNLTSRLARPADIDALHQLMNAAIGELQKPFLNEQQIASSRTIMGLDTQLIEDGIYFVVEAGGQLAGCGGWSRRATLYGGDQTPGRSAALLDPARDAARVRAMYTHPAHARKGVGRAALLDPARDAARVRAMYTHPAHARKGVGRMILGLCEAAARSEGFRRVELMGTLAGEPLYRACGYEPIERVEDAKLAFSDR
jgi:GNAT superfamily N-acetyltransferase